jgi:general secretion pathway protein K
MDSELFAIIEPYVCVLPTDQLRINVNTAHPQVVAALNPSISSAQIEGIALSERTYADVNQITAEIPELAAATDAIGVASEFFEIQIRAQVDDSLVELASTLHRNPNDGTITLLTRDFGAAFRSRFLDELTVSEE